VSQGCIKPLCDLLVCPNPRIVTVCLDGLENFLKVGEAEKSLSNTGDVNLYAQTIKDVEGLEKGLEKFMKVTGDVSLYAQTIKDVEGLEKGLEKFLKVGEAEKGFGNTGDVNLYAQMIEDVKGLEKIENLHSHDDKEIYGKAVKILETYWLEDEDETLTSWCLV